MTDTIKEKCLMCPRKGFIRINDALQCLGCNKYIHQGCRKKTHVNYDGSFQYCCGKKNLFLIDSDEKKDEDNTSLGSDNEKSEEVDSSSVDPSLKPLLTAIQQSLKSEISQLSSKISRIDINLKGFNENMNGLNMRIESIDTKVIDVVQRVKSIEEHKMNITQEVFIEVKERLLKECNFIVYKFQDSSTAHKTDLDKIKNILKDAPFSPDVISVTRLGRKFSKKNCRPLRVKLDSAESISWVFYKRSELFADPMYIKNDMTKSQQNLYHNLKEELKTRIEGGESDLVINYNKGFPKIIKKPELTENDNEMKKHGCCDNGLYLNLVKCCFIIFGKNKIQPLMYSIIMIWVWKKFL